MGEDDKNPNFHDFLGMSCIVDDNSSPHANKACERETMAAEASIGLVSGISGLGSERQGANSSEMNTISEADYTDKISGRKRSSSSSYMSLVRDRVLSVGTDSLEGSHHMKAFGKEVVGERLGRSHDDNMPCSMQPPSRIPTRLLLHSPVISRPDSLISNWERSLPTNVGSMFNFSSRFGQSGTKIENLSSSYTHKNSSTGPISVNSAAADEGSRTGIKSSGILSIINPGTNKTVERNLVGIGNSKASQVVEPEASNFASHHNLASSSRQMTIFYAGQAHVFDDVHPNKADIIMALAGSNGGSWSTNYFHKPGERSPVSETKAPTGENETRKNNPTISFSGVPDRGVPQAAHCPSDLQTLIHGGHQGGVVSRDPRLATHMAEPVKDGKSDV